MVIALVVPAAPVLLPSSAGLVDPVAELRAVLETQVRRLLEARPSTVTVLAAAPTAVERDRGLTTSTGEDVARHLLDAAGWTGPVEVVPPGAQPATWSEGTVLLVAADGTARRTEKAPGWLDDRAEAYDRTVEEALASGDPAALARLDADLGDALLAAGVPVLQALAAAWPTGSTRADAEVVWSGAPFGVQYWVARWATP